LPVLACADLVLAERRQAAITTAKLSPPDYIIRELGERPSDPEKRKSWDKGVSEIERYRQEHGIKDPEHALGRERGHEHDWNREQARQRLQQRQADCNAPRGGTLAVRPGTRWRSASDPTDRRLWRSECGGQPPAGAGRRAPLTSALAARFGR
jgi:hypothetical protein